VDRKTALHRLIVFLVITIGVNLLIGTQLTYRAVVYMDTPQFCGATCHVMRPQYQGHQESNHASVACAECHIAPGAGGWVEAKMNEQAARLPRYTMQCVDCHDRPTHAFTLPDRALNRALAIGEISATLPFIKQQGLAALQASYASSADAARKIPAAIHSYYQQTYPQVYARRKADVDQVAQAVLAIYNRNVFPDLRVTWGTYTNSLGHVDFPGCFRCHDGSHTTADGQDAITQDCGACHQLLAMQESSPDILKTLGLWDHIEALKAHAVVQPEVELHRP